MKTWVAGEDAHAEDINKNFAGILFPFGGDGSDGDLIITSGTTTVDLGGQQYVVKNYSSLSITGTGKLAFSNPHANGTVLIIKVRGDVTLTSSTTPNIDLRGIGASTGVTPTNFAGVATVYGNGVTNGSIWDKLTEYTVYNPVYKLMFRHSLVISCGASGAVGQNGYLGKAGGSAGRGGGAMILECAGAFNFTVSDGIDCSGQDGGNGTVGTGATNDSGGAGGGGGSAGQVLILYANLTANSGTVKAAGGKGGDGASGTNTWSFGYGGSQGGGAAASMEAAGNAGAGAGGKGGNGNGFNWGSSSPIPPTNGAAAGASSTKHYYVGPSR